MTLLSEIKIPNESYKFKEDEEEGDIVKNLSKVNIFVGANNEGKSRFLRSLFSNINLHFVPYDDIIHQVNKANSSVLNNLRTYLKENFIKTPTSVNQMLEKIDSKIFFSEENDYLKTILEIKEELNSLSPNSHITNKKHTNIRQDKFGKHLIKIIDKSFSEHFNTIPEGIKFPYKFKKCYIPILRGLRPIDYSRDKVLENYPKDEYQIRTKADYFEEFFERTAYEHDQINPFEYNNGFIVSTGLKTYYNIMKYMHDIDDKKKKLIDEFEEYLSKNFFENNPVEIRPLAGKKYDGKDEILVKIGDEEGKMIYDLGDGIQSIIIMTLPLFLYKGAIGEKDTVLVFIEEPEHLLHPGLQRKLMDLFLDEKLFNNFQFFFTTHSNHFLDITIDYDNISIYSFKKELKEGNPEFTIENLSKGDANALELLGVRNSSVFLSNCTIWVEGITDVGYLRHYLDIYLRENPDKLDPEQLDIKEDYHYSFVEYCGNNVTHWSFLDDVEDKPLNVETLCGRLFLIVDKDAGKEERHEKLSDFLGDRLYVLNAREIENLISDQVLLKIVADYENNDSNLEQDIKYNMYKDKPLGKYIDEKVIINRQNSKIKTYATASGTIRYKNTFLKKAKNYIKSWDDLSKDAQNLTRQIFNFIVKSNS